MLYAITGTMTPSKLSLGLFFTATAMLVLPLIYIGLIVASDAACGGTCFHTRGCSRA